MLRTRCCVSGSSKTAIHQMNAMQSTELICQFLQDRLGVSPDAMVSGALLVDLGVDSLMLAELLFEAEDRLGISIGSHVATPKSLGEMVALIDTLRAAKAPTS